MKLLLLLVLQNIPAFHCEDSYDVPREDSQDKGIPTAPEAKESLFDKETSDTIIQGEESPLHSFSDDDILVMGNNNEKFAFQADVNRVMNILTHSLYSHREVFLRELISNAVDAIDKVRYEHLTKGIREGTLEVRVRADEKLGTLTITDSGIGMNKSDLTENLGTLARSGTTKFLEASEKSASDNLQFIGQFGVGFYSCFLVANEVTVVTKYDSDDQYIQKSTSDGSFNIVKDPRGNTLPRGTSVILKLKDDSKEFLDDSLLRETIKRYSEFMTHPIYLYTKEESDEKVPIDSQETEKDDNEVADGEEFDDDLVVDDEGNDEDKFKTVKKIIYKQEHLNPQQPIWTRSRNEVSEDDYLSFYRALMKDDDSNYISHIHFAAEGEIAFKSLLYIPDTAPNGFYDNYYQKKSTIRLYVRRVLINDKFEDFIPRYLSFVKGLLDSNDLPLNVNREQLQKSKVMKVISKRLTKKTLEMIRKLADSSEPIIDEDDSEDDSDDNDKENIVKDNEMKNKYFKFWKEFGKSIKMGFLEDGKNQNILKKLLRFPSSANDENPISFETYISRMKEKQKGIFYISGESIESIKDSPSLEKVKKAGYEVLYFVDPLDEYLVAQIRDYEDIKLMSVTAEGLEMHEISEKEKSYQDEVKEDYNVLTKWFKKILSDRVAKVEISKRLDQSPCILVSTEFGPSVNMERIQKFQPLSSQGSAQQSKRVLELNYRHPVIQEMKSRIESLGSDESIKNPELVEFAETLYDSAMLNGGYTHDNPSMFAERINKLLRVGLGIPMTAEVDPEREFPDDLEKKNVGQTEDTIDLDEADESDHVNRNEDHLHSDL